MLVILCLVFYLIGFMLRTVRYGAQQCWLFPRNERLAGALTVFYTSLSPSFLIQLEYKISSFNEAFVGENTRKNLHQDRQPGNGKQAMTEIQNLSLAVRRRPNASNRTTKVSKILNFLFDALAGVTFYLVTRNFYPPDSLACYFVLCRDSTHHFLNILLEWLMGAPAGLKLSHELTMFLGNFFQYHIYIWIGYLSILEPFYALIINSIMCSSFLGLSVMLSLASDFLSFLTFHTYCFYVYAGKIYQLQLQGLISLSRLMRGEAFPQRRFLYLHTVCSMGIFGRVQEVIRKRLICCKMQAIRGNVKNGREKKLDDRGTSVVFPHLGRCSKIYSLSSLQSPVKSHLSNPNNPNLTKSPTPCPSSFSRRSFHLLQIISRALLSGHQGDYSCSSEACKDHQKLNYFTPFLRISAYFTDSIPQIIIHRIIIVGGR